MSTDALAVVVNGSDRTIPTGMTVDDLVAETAARVTGVAVALNGAVVVRAEWPSTRLTAGDRVEILTAAPGG